MDEVRDIHKQALRETPTERRVVADATIEKFLSILKQRGCVIAGWNFDMREAPKDEPIVAILDRVSPVQLEGTDWNTLSHSYEPVIAWYGTEDGWIFPGKGKARIIAWHSVCAAPPKVRLASNALSHRR